MCSINFGRGWSISEQGYNIISLNNTITDKNILLNNALNADLREIGLAALNKDYNKHQIHELVLQVQKIRNVAAPKANEESNAAPRMLKLTLTDGETFVQAIEVSNIPFISRERTPPGSKILLTNVKFLSGFLCLNQNNTKLLGGNVPHLYEKWELAKSVQHHSRSVASIDGPPAWVNFGVKVSNLFGESQAPDSSKTKEQVKENIEFENLRKDAIAEAATGAVRRVFGAGAKLVKVTPRNDSNRVRSEGGKPLNKNKKETKMDKECVPQKPSDKVSLFDFLENKLQIAEASGDIKSNLSDEYEKSFQNNQSNNYHQKNVLLKKEFQYHHKDGEKSYFNYELDNTKPINCKQTTLYHGDSENNKKHCRNKEQMNSFKQYEHDNYFKNEINDFSNGQHSKNISIKKNSSARQNEYVKKFDNIQKNSSNDSSSLKNNHICKRNEEEKLQDDWHYRAPQLSTQGLNKSSNNIDNLTEHVAKISISGEFASRSLRQHLNLQGKKPVTTKKHIDVSGNDCVNSFNVGDECLAKYWEDNKFYPSLITATTETTYVVQFKGYGNIEEVLRSDCIPLDKGREEKRKYRGALEFRRNPKKIVS